MYWLPPLAWRERALLPLCPGTMDLLLGWFVEEEIPPEPCRTERQLLVDPILVYWVCEQRGMWDPCGTLADVAGQLGRPLAERILVQPPESLAVSDGYRAEIARARRTALALLRELIRCYPHPKAARESPQALQIVLRHAEEYAGPSRRQAAFEIEQPDVEMGREWSAVRRTPWRRVLRKARRDWIPQTLRQSRLWQAIAGRLVRYSAPEAEYRRSLRDAKLAAMKELAYGASHEINNPLANIATRAQVLLKREDRADVRRNLAAIQEQALRAHDMITDLMQFARPPALQISDVDVDDVLREFLQHLRGLAQQRGIRLSLEPVLLHRDRHLQADRVQLIVALNALGTNALEAVGDAGTIRILTDSQVDGTGRTWLSVRLVDSGPGLDPRVTEHLFDPFFSGREAGRGLGFGLCKVWQITKRHGGTIDALTRPEGGAEFRLRIPCLSEDPAWNVGTPVSGRPSADPNV